MHNLYKEIPAGDANVDAGGGMVAYEFYFRDERRGDKLIGILPERRQSPERVNQESIMNWAKIVFSRMVETGNVFFIRVKLERNGNGRYFAIPHRSS